MKFGIMLNPRGIGWSDLRAIWTTAERLGFDSSWIPDHLMPMSGDRTAPQLEGWTTLTALAVATERIRIGTMVNAVTFRHPALLAKMAATLDGISGGRLTVGLGAGNLPAEHQIYGIPFPSGAERAALLAETCQILRGLWSGDPFSFQGQFFQLDEAPCEPRPVQRPSIPLLIGGTGERHTLPLVARFADVWNMPPQPHGISPATFAAKHAILRDRCREIGRDPTEIETTIGLIVLVNEDASEALARRRLLAESSGWSDQQTDERLIAGDPAMVTARLREYEAAGLDHFILIVVPSLNVVDLPLFADAVLRGW